MTTRLRLRRIFWIGAAAILVVAALIALAAILRGGFSDNDARVLLTLGAILYTGGAALTGLALLDRGGARLLGWAVVALAPVSLAFIAWSIWSFTFDGGGNESADKLAWSAAIVVLAALLATTALLFARRRELVALAILAGALAALTATLSIVAIWASPDADAYPKIVGILLVLTVLCYFLVPVLQRYAAGVPTQSDIRILGALDSVELVAVRGDAEGLLVDQPVRGEQLILRRRS